MEGLEPTAEEMQRMVAEASRLVIDFLANINSAPAAQYDDVDARTARIREPLPEQGCDFSQLMETIRDTVIGCSVNTAGPTYQAYIPGGGVFPAAVAEFVAAATNRYVGVYGVAPGPVEIEATVLRWFSQLIGYDEKSRGILTSGGSLANFSAVVAARRALLPENFLSGIIYTSDQVHHSVTKAAIMAGLPARNIRVVATDELFRLRTDLLKAHIDEDRRAGLTPFLVVASAGTTNTGAIDPINEIADLCAENKLWLHVDAAYGGAFLLTERGRALMPGMARADSVTLDPHKGLFLPYGTGALLVRDGEALRRAHQVDASYLQDLAAGEEVINFSDYSPELTRSFRGLRVWLPLKLFGAARFRAYLDEKLDLARWACEQLREIDGIEIVAQPQLTVVAFRYRAANGADNSVNRRILEIVNGTRRTFLSSTTIDGRVLLRIAVLCFRTHRGDVEITLNALRDAVRAVQ